MSRGLVRLVAIASLLLAAAGCRGEIEGGGGDKAGGPPPQPTKPAPAAAVPAAPSSTQTAEGASQRCEASKPGPPLLRRLTRLQFERSLRDIFPEVAGEWQGLALADTSSRLGFSNDASVLVVGAQAAEELLKSAEQLATLVSEPAQLERSLPCAKSQPDASCGRQLITRYGERLFRRPLSAAELERYQALFASVSASASFAAAAKWALVALIQSPHTLYRRELGDLTAPATALDDYELATELAYTFSDTTPDPELLARAKRGELIDPDVRVNEARRLLETSGGREMIQQFVREWLRYGSVQTADRPDVPGWDAIRAKLQAETAHFVEQVAYDAQGGLRELLTAPYTFADRELAAYYGWGGGSDVLELRERPAGQGLGLLAQGAVLASAANVHATSPTHRGLLVYERLLCRTKPRPPANVPPLSEGDPGQVRTTRQRYEQAHARGVCNSCHSQFDPLGFAFEHFDSGGRYRADEQGEPIDASGQLTRSDGRLVQFAGADELAKQLADSEEVNDCISGLLVQYAFGGAGGAACLAEEARAGLRRGELGLVEALAQLAAAPHFSRRTLDAEGPERPVPAVDAAVPEAGSVEPDAAADASGAPEPTGDPVDIGITAQYQATNAAASDNVIGPFFRITNRDAAGGVPLAALRLRYYFTNEHSGVCPEGCVVESYYAGVQPTGMGVVATRSYVAGRGDDAYLEITFPADAPVLSPGQSVELQQQFHTKSYDDFDESDDYSFDPAQTVFADSARITVYRDDTLVWGVPPP
jgi:hypothetical protein